MINVKVFSTFYSHNMTLAMTKASKTSAPTEVIIRWSLIGQKSSQLDILGPQIVQK